MRIMIAGTGSGGGKTTVSCALLAALKRQGKNVVSFKCGPDYIDPTFHRRATGVDSFNLDVFLMGEAGVFESLVFHSRDRDIALLEGAMGLYDGIGQGSEASSNRLSLLTKTPVVLVVDTKGKGVSVCAEIQGFMNFEENRIVAVILNRTKETSYDYYKNMIEDRTGAAVVGFLPPLPDAAVESRYLGLVMANELTDIQNKIAILAEQAGKTVDLDAILDLASQAEKIDAPRSVFFEREQTKTLRIYVAFDPAFCFHYADNHRILEYFGAEICFFSPLEDAEIPGDAAGLVFWGGYPELHASQLAGNESIKRDILKKHAQGMPIFAECGGFMYMNNRIVDSSGIVHSMLGLVDGDVSITDRLQRFGYVELASNKDNMFCKKGDRINAHSFHYSRSSEEGHDFTARKAGSDRSWPCIVATEKLFTGYPHIHFAGNPGFAERFVEACLSYRKRIDHENHHESD